ncbi:hypothetical protein NPA07_04540 [Mycoplasmopsis caviae]|uniref:Uncharacterized protein n=1 Tax=Mycoplasmopsis caviae TaxID=55603 RepID=A0A3P8K9R1_9BACT|nr:hypothetical protein [Mycoplasmopsis caviae]UUD35045.1 hypothetical protein NPA07_04540 [Mycoplasmopsis caviae]VDR42129.1 Uncharacterised protein [Mycoplasmopsis caviae]
MYFVPLYLLIKKSGKIKDLVSDFTALISIYGGTFITIFSPDDVFVANIFRSIHSMIYHGCMLLIGMILIVNNFTRFKNGAFIANSYLMYVIVWSVAIIGNEIMYQVFKNNKELWLSYLPNFLSMSHRQFVSITYRFEHILKINSRQIYWIVPFICLIVNFIGAYLIYGTWWFIGWIIRKIESKYRARKQTKLA